jgi:hypothetical protein
MGLRANLYMLFMACFFLLFKHLFRWRYQYNKYTFNFIHIYSFITVSGCVGAVLFPGVNNTKVTLRVSLMDQELLTLPEHLSSPK